FLQTPPLASDALAIRIVFPLVRVTPFSFKWTGLPALLGKQQREAKLPFELYVIANIITQMVLGHQNQYVQQPHHLH
ncbi:hypothetical protein D8T51_14045, partial [Vibrio vulnificus]